ncbi:MAG TPA: hypothetical protein VF813_05520, partial [Anaerolineaceae bacterium]
PCSVVDVTARVVRWSQPGEDTHVLVALLEKTKEKLDREEPGAWMQLVEQRLGSTAAGEQSIGLLALRLVIEDPAFENFPAVFRLLSPLVQSPGGAVSHDLARVIQLLAARTPKETTMFLHRILSVTPDRSILRLVRRCLPAFDPPDQQLLREAIGAHLGGG